MTVRRVASEHGRHHGRRTLEQRFLFEGASAAALVELLLTAPLTGDGSVFGSRPGEEEAREGGRRLRGFSPAPGFRFDVDLESRAEGQVVVRFSQPQRSVPYLEGAFAWLFRDVPDGAVLDEHINTSEALAVAGEPLGGRRPSLRRWLFFRAGHRQVMDGATNNLAALHARSA